MAAAGRVLIMSDGKLIAGTERAPETVREPVASDPPAPASG
jgi:hypothetical protein